MARATSARYARICAPARMWAARSAEIRRDSQRFAQIRTDPHRSAETHIGIGAGISGRGRARPSRIFHFISFRFISFRLIWRPPFTSIPLMSASGQLRPIKWRPDPFGGPGPAPAQRGPLVADKGGARAGRRRRAHARQAGPIIRLAALGARHHQWPTWSRGMRQGMRAGSKCGSAQTRNGKCKTANAKCKTPNPNSMHMHLIDRLCVRPSCRLDCCHHSFL